LLSSLGGSKMSSNGTEWPKPDSLSHWCVLNLTMAL
jgi:hypothetical protein